MHKNRNRLKQLEQTVASRQSDPFEIRVAGRPVEESRRELAALFRQEASRTGLSDEMRRSFLQGADSLESQNNPASGH